MCANPNQWDRNVSGFPDSPLDDQSNPSHDVTVVFETLDARTPPHLQELRDRFLNDAGDENNCSIPSGEDGNNGDEAKISEESPPLLCPAGDDTTHRASLRP